MTIKKGRDLSLLFRWCLHKFAHKNARVRALERSMLVEVRTQTTPPKKYENRPRGNAKT